jgi:hypothetical protein
MITTRVYAATLAAVDAAQLLILQECSGYGLERGRSAMHGLTQARSCRRKNLFEDLARHFDLEALAFKLGM